MKIVSALIAAALLAGCATTTRVSKDVSPGFEWKSPSGKSYFVTGEIVKTTEYSLTETRWGNRLVVSANGSPSITGMLDGRSFSGNASGQIDTYAAVASCTSIQRSQAWWDVTCEIAADGQRIGVLRF